MTTSRDTPGRVGAREATEQLLDAWDEVQQLMVRMPRVIEARLGIPPHRLHVLGAVDRGATRIQDIADASWTSVSAASRTVDGLVRDGWLDRRPDPDDRRASHVRLTALGAAHFGEVHAFAVGLLQRIVDELGVDRAERMARDLTDFAGQVAASLDEQA